jgi:O-antigen/teichoic acid export membrane protein
VPFRELKHRIERSRFARNVAIVATGTAGAQAITMAFAPLITRLYGPEAFGVMGAFMAMVSIAAPLAALSYPIAIVLPENDQDALGLAKLSLLIGISMAAAALLIIFFLHEPILALLNVQVLGSFIFLIPAAMLFSAGVAVMQQWVIRKKLFRIKAKIAVANAFLVNIAKTGMGLVNPIAAILVVLSVLGTLLHGLMLLGSVRRVDRMFSLKRFQSTPLRKLAMRHKDFPLYRTPQVALNSSSMALPVLILASVSGPASAGFYTLSKTVLGLPVALIGQSVADVFYPRINEAVVAGENAGKLIAKATIALGLIGLIPFATVIAFGPQLFSFVFGHDWTTAGEYARWLALWIFATFISRPSVAAIPVLGLQGVLLVYEVISVTLRVATLFGGFLLFESDITAIALFSLSGVLINMGFLLFTLYSARARDTN